MQEALRKRMVAGMKFGQPLHISMSNSAVAFKSKFCAEGLFPPEIFKNELFLKEEIYRKSVRDSDLVDWPGAFKGRMKEGCYSFVTTDFTLASAREHLAEALPFFEDMAIIEVDPACFNK